MNKKTVNKAAFLFKCRQGNPCLKTLDSKSLHQRFSAECRTAAVIQESVCNNCVVAAFAFNFHWYNSHACPRPSGPSNATRVINGADHAVMNLSCTAASIVRTICAGFAIQSFTRLSVKHCGMFLWTIGELARFPLRAVLYNMFVGQTSKTKTF